MRFCVVREWAGWITRALMDLARTHGYTTLQVNRDHRIDVRGQFVRHQTWWAGEENGKPLRGMIGWGCVLASGGFPLKAAATLHTRSVSEGPSVAP